MLGLGDARRVVSFTHGGQILPVTANEINDALDPSDFPDATSLKAMQT